MPTASATAVRPGSVDLIPACGAFASVSVHGWGGGGVLISLARPGLSFSFLSEFW